jgi:hypothetical protein
VNGGRPKELARRQNDGVVVSLLWRRADGKLTVVVDDTRTGEKIRLPARRENALEVFYHPFAYAPKLAA